MSPEWWEFYDAMSDCPDRVVFRRPVNAVEQPDGVSLHKAVGGWFIEKLSP